MPKRKYDGSSKNGSKKAKTSSSTYARVPRANSIVRTARIGRGPISDRAVVTLKYSQLNNSNGVLNDQVFNLNSLQDPDRTGGGHQPLGFDQYSAFYSKYKVFKAKITVQAASSTGNTMVGIHADNVGSAYSGLTNYKEQPGCIMKVAVANNNPVYLTKTVKLWELTGRTWQDYMADDTYGAAFSTSPTEVLVAHIGYWDISGAIVANNALFWITTIEFSCELYDPIPLGSS